MPHDGTDNVHYDTEWQNLEKSIELDNQLRSASEMSEHDLSESSDEVHGLLVPLSQVRSGQIR